jgi:DNA-directed RNA polymerase specialized sigma24 family protein
MAMLTSTERPSQTASDKDLARALTAGEIWAAEEVARVHWPNAYRVARLLLGEDRAAEDAAQDSIVSAIRSIATFGEERAPAS